MELNPDVYLFSLLKELFVPFSFRETIYRLVDIRQAMNEESSKRLIGYYRVNTRRISKRDSLDCQQEISILEIASDLSSCVTLPFAGF